MARVRFTWNMREFERIRRSPQMMARLSREASAIRSAAGIGYTASTMQGKTRARANVAAFTYDARLDNAQNQTLLRALGRGNIS